MSYFEVSSSESHFSGFSDQSSSDSDESEQHVNRLQSAVKSVNNKRAQRALGRSPEEKVKGHSGANNREPQGE